MGLDFQTKHKPHALYYSVKSILTASHPVFPGICLRSLSTETFGALGMCVCEHLHTIPIVIGKKKGMTSPAALHPVESLLQFPHAFPPPSHLYSLGSLYHIKWLHFPAAEGWKTAYDTLQAPRFPRNLHRADAKELGRGV